MTQFSAKIWISQRTVLDVRYISTKHLLRSDVSNNRNAYVALCLMSEEQNHQAHQGGSHIARSA